MSLTNREMSLPVLAALLTIIGYSVNDTIVAYDRVRENRAKGVRKGQTFAELDQRRHQPDPVPDRPDLAHGLLLAPPSCFFFGGKVLEDFAFVLIVGVVTGHLLDDLHRRRP